MDDLKTRSEQYLSYLTGDSDSHPDRPQSTMEQYFAYLTGHSESYPERPSCRMDMYLEKLCQSGRAPGSALVQFVVDGTVIYSQEFEVGTTQLIDLGKSSTYMGMFVNGNSVSAGNPPLILCSKALDAALVTMTEFSGFRYLKLVVPREGYIITACED